MLSELKLENLRVQAQAQNICLEIVILLFAFMVGVLSYIYSLYVQDSLWFGRSGSIIVILSVWVESMNYNVQQKMNKCAQKAAGYIGGPHLNWDMPSSRKWMEKITISIIVLGTLIWGYGDLIVI